MFRKICLYFVATFFSVVFTPKNILPKIFR